MRQVCLQIPTLAALVLLQSTVSADDMAGRASISFVSENSGVGPRSWLDPLRESRKQRPATGSMDKAADEAEFDLSEFSQSPDGISENSASRVRSVSDPVLTSTLPDPAEPVNVPGSDLESDPFQQSARYQTTTPQSVFSECPPDQRQQNLCWQVLPKGLLYRTYLAGEKEPRMQFLSLYDTRSKRKVWDAVLGGRVGILRKSDTCNPNGDAFQLDLEGAVFARVLPDEESTMLEGSDYRVGLYGTWRRDRWSYRAGYYHISSHVGDEFLIANPAFNRINYVRDSLLAGASYDLSEITRIYGELGYALGIEGGA